MSLKSLNLSLNFVPRPELESRGKEKFQGGVGESLTRSVGSEEVRNFVRVGGGEILWKGFVGLVVGELSVGLTKVFSLVHDNSGGTLASR